MNLKEIKLFIKGIEIETTPINFNQGVINIIDQLDVNISIEGKDINPEYLKQLIQQGKIKITGYENIEPIQTSS